MPDLAPLPRPDAADGTPRLIGVEIEFAGIPEDSVARVVTDSLGGTATQDDGPFWTVADSALGDLEIYLDTALRKFDQSSLRDELLRVGREVIPVEIVTAPLDMNQMERLNALVSDLRHAGAQGSGAGLFFGFGIHFNVQIASEQVEDIHRPLMAYALIEDWLRAAQPIDETRRALPFTDPYPTAFVRALIEAGNEIGLSELIALYLEHCPSRNFGLDMLPIFAHLAPGRVENVIGAATSARPTFHFRLPDCRIDEPGWSLADEWNRWIAVERVAGDAALLARLAHEWRDDHGPITLSRGSWADRAGDILDGVGITT
ncbi:amidoligase family protein [Lutimaribacter sp. EGI FJ00015]|uniref:Amidoligase family protein n=1 Tax=Lutimaribacter degradans TaxID=2945989 RepID=A0ACC5ZTU8_9RHOB|nr:amidoligase family protein [Lutimaribacter sp. EGI FJ00013]MCM2561773.1 amidoligase family protein [Lutimaribacter sp. EGI FJ00013]MCO0613194.1 amidoligase family protein [Lutimaribacter sp. EGI FJ00015]MCO0635606.1 amidoligase family protein [Lutimaribacter sp. EGI FJ00014]